MSEYYDIDGNPITMEEWSQMFGSRRAMREGADNGESTPEEDWTRIGSTHIGTAWISTVWLGLDHSFGDGPPLIFETMVFGGAFDQDGERWSTKEQALAGHEAWCEKVRAMQSATSGT